MNAMFNQFKLAPYDYYIDKYRGEQTQHESVPYTLRFASVHFKLKDVEK